MGAVEFKIEGHEGPSRLLERLQHLGARPFLIHASRVAMNQLRRRIQVEKAEPDGAPWAEWSEAYARTREPQHSIGIDTGEMLRNIKRRLRGSDQAEVFVDVDYAKHFAKRRPLTGFGAEDVDQVVDVFESRMESVLEEAFR